MCVVHCEHSRSAQVGGIYSNYVLCDAQTCSLCVSSLLGDIKVNSGAVPVFFGTFVFFNRFSLKDV